MVTKLYIAIFLAQLLSACSQMTQKSNPYSSVSLRLAESGQIKWSDYYKGLYESVARNQLQGENLELLTITYMIELSMGYEAGSINWQQFSAARKEALKRLNSQ